MASRAAEVRPTSPTRHQVEKLKRVADAAAEHGFECLETECLGHRDQWRFRCPEGHVIQRTAESVLNRKIVCEVCRAERTDRKIVAHAASVGWKVVAGFGGGTNGMWEFTCERGHEIHRKGDQFLRSNPVCKLCVNAELVEQASAIAEERGGELLTDSVASGQDTAPFRCEVGHYFERPLTDVVHRDLWCTVCSGRGDGVMLNKVRAIAESQGGKCLSDHYLSFPQKMQFECEHGHSFEKEGDAVVHKGAWCPVCAAELGNDYIEALKTVVQEHGGKLLSPTVSSATELLQFECKVGHRFEQSATRVVHRGTWCPECAYAEKAEARRLGIEAVQARAAEKGGRCLSTEYNTAEDVGEFECAKGHRWETQHRNILYGDRWCPTCAIEARSAGRTNKGELFIKNHPRRLELEDCQLHAEKHGGRCLSVEYINHLTPMEWECRHGHQWEASLHNMEGRKHFCLECAEKERRAEMLRRAADLASQNGGRLLSTKWTHSTAPLRWESACGVEFERSWNSVRSARFCNQCE